MKTTVSKLRTNWFLQCLFTVLMMPGLILFPVAVTANPNKPTVRSGSVSFQGLNTSSLNINQATRNAVINWQNFSVGTNESTRFNQPSRNSLTVNRVTGGNLSSIYGQLSANGNVIVINPNGIVVGPTGVIDVAGALTLSTLDASDNDLLNGGSARYRGTSGAGVSNYGAISAGDVTILGNFISNQGSIVADRSIALGAGGDIIVNQTADGATISVRGGAPGGGTGISNSGSVEGGNVQMATHGNSYAMAINNQGTVRAKGYNFRGGRLTLNAGRSGGIVNTGNLYAQRQNGSGGQIKVSGGDVNIASGRVDASGSSGMDGGDISVAGTDVTVGADALLISDGITGGSVNLAASNNLTVAGTISSTGEIGNGGQVDLSGEFVNVEASAIVDASGLSGGRIRAGGGMQGNEADIRNSRETNIAAGSLMIADGSLGDGGDVIVWSDGDTMFGGEVTARATGLVGNGGFIEISGKSWLSYLGFANTSAANGINGTLLLDPSDVVVGPAGGGVTISDAALVAAVLLNNVVIHTSSSGVAAGDITINPGSDIQYDSPNSLSFFANRHIFVNGDIKNHGTTDTAWEGTGHITLVAGWDGTGAGAFGFDPDTGTPGGADPTINAASVVAGTYGDYGLNNGSIFINDAAVEPVEIGSARGETNAFGDLFFMTAGNNQGEFTQFGYRRENDMRGTAISGLGADGQLGGIGADADTFINTGTGLSFDNGVTGDINIYAKGGVFAIQNQGSNVNDGVKTNDRAYVMIGHGGIREQDNDIDNRTGAHIAGSAFDTVVITNSITGAEDYGSDARNISVGNGDNHGNITIESGGVVFVQGGRAETHAQIGHGGLANDDPDADRGNTVSDSGLGDNNFRNIHVFGNMTGDITINAATLDLEGGFLNDAPVMVGHGGTRIRGEHSGNITITTTGGVRVRAAPTQAIAGVSNSNDWRWRSNRDQSHAQIGHGGFDSDFIFVDSLAGWDGAKTNDIAAVVGVNRDRGQYDTSGTTDRSSAATFMDSLPRRTVTLATRLGDLPITNTSYAGDGISINNIRGRFDDSGGATGVSFGHNGDININAGGSVEFVAANGTDAYAMLGHGGRSTHGDHNGDITVNAGGSVIFSREGTNINSRGRDVTNRGHRAHVQLGHGGTRYVGGATGDIDVNAGGNVEFYAGRSEAYAQLGHGGRGNDSSSGWGNDGHGQVGRQRNEHANGTHSGDINVVAGGDIRFRSGYTDVQAHSQLGHGGYFQYADVLVTTDPNSPGTPWGGGASAADQIGHNGDITVTSGGDISFIAGPTDLLPGQSYIEMNGADNYTMLGHGGRNSKGDNWGNIDINAAGNLNLEARGGWDAVTIEGSNETGAPRLNSTEDNGRTGYRNFAHIGHGGFDSEHINTNATDNWNNSGVNGNGIGVLGDSNININIGGDLIALAAMKATTADRPMGIRVFDGPLTAGNPNNGNVVNDYVDEAGNVVLAGPLYSRFNGRLETINRTDGEVWDMPDPVLSAEDSYVQIGNGGRATDYHGSGGAVDRARTISAPVDGLGHRGDVTINAGGNIRVEASDIKQSVSTGQAIEIVVTNYQGPAGSGTVGGAGVHRVGPSALNFGGGFINNRPIQDDPSQGTRNYAMIGTGGDTARGDHLTTININGGGDLDLIAGEGRQAFAQIGSGGYDSDRVNSDNQRDGDTGATATININIDGKLTMEGGGLQNGDTTGQVASYDGVNPVVVTSDNDIVRGSYVQIGSGGLSNGGSHHADIDIVTGAGVELTAGNSHRGAYGMIGSGGTWGRSENLTGNISVVATGGDIIVQGGIAVLDSLDDPNSGSSNAGNVQTARESYAQIGNGGFDTDAQGGNQNNAAGDGSGYTGSIRVIASTGNVEVRGGGSDTLNADNDNFRATYAKIGHGGPFTDGDSVGDILVTAGLDLNVVGGRGNRNSFAHIGHGNNNDNGDKSGTIEIVAGRDLLMQRGGRNDANGILVRDAFSKIGHGNTSLRYGSDGAGTRTGHIYVSVGRSIFTLNGVDGTGAATTFGPEIGHVAFDRDNVGVPIGSVGDTFIAVSRKNPTGDPTLVDGLGNPVEVGIMSLSDGTSITSTDGGLTTQVRLYMPTSAENSIATGTDLNTSPYSRVALGGVGNRFGIDEHAAIEHTQTTGAFGEPEGTFTPEGAYPFHALGLYNVYYAEFAAEEPVDPTPEPPGEGPTGPTGPTEPVIPQFDFAPYVFLDAWENYDWPDDIFDFDGNEVHWGILGYGEAVEGLTYIPRSGIEAFLDAGLGDRTGVLISNYDGLLVFDSDSSANAFAPTAGELETSEWQMQLENRATSPGVDARIFYLYEPGSNVYSSMRLFGHPNANVPTFAPGQ